MAILIYETDFELIEEHLSLIRSKQFDSNTLDSFKKALLMEFASGIDRWEELVRTGKETRSTKTMPYKVSLAVRFHPSTLLGY